MINHSRLVRLEASAIRSGLSCVRRPIVRTCQILAFILFAVATVAGCFERGKYTYVAVATIAAGLAVSLAPAVFELQS